MQDLDALTNSNVYSDVPTPGSAVEAIYENGFLFSNGIGFRDGSGALLVHNEAFRWQPTQRGSDVEARAVSTGILELGKGVWGMLDVVHPKPGTWHSDWFQLRIPAADRLHAQSS